MTEPTETNDYTAAWASLNPRSVPVRRKPLKYEPGESDFLPTNAEQPGWKPRHRVTPMRPANPHTADQDGDNAYLYQGDHRLPGPDGNLIRGIVWAVIWIIVAAAVVYGAVEAVLWAYGSWTS